MGRDVTTLGSVGAERLNGIHTRGPAPGTEGGHPGDGRQQDRPSARGSRIHGLDLEQPGAERPGVRVSSGRSIASAVPSLRSREQIGM